MSTGENNNDDKSGKPEKGGKEKLGVKSSSNEGGEIKPQHDENAELKDRMLRLAAEFDNYKKRTKAEAEKAQTVGKAEVIKNLLPVLDEFELAMLSISSSQDKNLAKGVEMVYSNFVDSLEKEGLREISTDGVFDPYKHEIVVSRAENSKKPGTILEVVKKGYTFNGIMLRPASVIIAKEESNADRDETVTK